MKKNTNWVALITFILLVFITFCFLYSIQTATVTQGERYTSYMGTEIEGTDTSFGGIFATPNINDSLPYYLYNKEKEEFDKTYKEIKRQNEGVSMSGATYGRIMFGYTPNSDSMMALRQKESSNTKEWVHFIDSISEKIRTAKDTFEENKYKKYFDSVAGKRKHTAAINSPDIFNSNNNLYYFGLKGFTKKTFETKFFMQHNHYFLAKMVIDSTRKTVHSDDYYYHYKREEIPYRYNEKEKSLLIPMTKKYTTSSKC